MPTAPLDEAKFTAAWAYLCGVAADSTTAALAPKILAAAADGEERSVHARRAGALRQPLRRRYKGKRAARYGLLAIEPGMYRVPGAPELPVDKADLTSKRLLDPEVNLAVGAALLEMWNASHKEIDAAFGGGLHRTGVAHFIWGDVVRSSGQEDLILTARRRMIVSYLGNKDAPRLAPYVGLQRRVAAGGDAAGGDQRAGRRSFGRRAPARGLDIAGMLGEPVRAIADGTVIFAGINSPTKSRMSGIPPEKIARYRHRRMGVGGIYVCIEHTPEPKRVVSCYMHLGGYNVAEREQVKAGQVIGELGRTGVKVSPPHLHFEVRIGDRHTNPLRTLGDYDDPAQGDDDPPVRRARQARQAARAARLASAARARVALGCGRAPAYAAAQRAYAGSHERPEPLRAPQRRAGPGPAAGPAGVAADRRPRRAVPELHHRRHRLAHRRHRRSRVVPDPGARPGCGRSDGHRRVRPGRRSSATTSSSKRRSGWTFGKLITGTRVVRFDGHQGEGSARSSAARWPASSRSSRCRCCSATRSWAGTTRCRTRASSAFALS